MIKATAYLKQMVNLQYRTVQTLPQECTWSVKTAGTYIPTRNPPPV